MHVRSSLLISLPLSLSFFPHFFTRSEVTHAIDADVHLYTKALVQCFEKTRSLDVMLLLNF